MSGVLHGRCVRKARRWLAAALPASPDKAACRHRRTGLSAPAGALAQLRLHASLWPLLSRQSPCPCGGLLNVPTRLASYVAADQAVQVSGAEPEISYFGD